MKIPEWFKVGIHAYAFVLNCVGLFGATLFFLCLMVYRGTIYQVAPFVWWLLFCGVFQLWAVESVMVLYHLWCCLFHAKRTA